jgi:hypothetical protein
VFAALITASRQARIDFAVYMPECWAKGPRRRRKAGIPDRLRFATKPELAIERLKRLTAAGVRALWAAADEVYGRCGEFRDAAGRCRWPMSSSPPLTTRSPSQKTPSSALTRQYATRCSNADRAGTGRKAPLQRLGADRHRGPRGSSC